MDFKHLTSQYRKEVGLMKNTGLVLYDSATRKKRAFIPADKRRITMYVCGPTVYNYAHIGNFRPAVVFDILFRVLRYYMV